MNKAKTLKRKLGSPKLFLECVLHSEGNSELPTRFLSVAWNTEDIPSQVFVNPHLKWGDINWKRIEKNVSKLQKLIYRASSRGKIRKMHKYQKLLSKSYYPRLLVVRFITQDYQSKKTVGVDCLKILTSMERLNLVQLLNGGFLKPSLKGNLAMPSIYNRALQVLVKLGMEPEIGF